MRLKANDTLSVSSVGPENISPKGEFEVSDAEGAALVERGLAVEVKGAKAPANKMEPAPANKGTFDHDGDGRPGGSLPAKDRPPLSALTVSAKPKRK